MARPHPPEGALNGLCFLRHALATLAYRAAKALRDAPPGFERFRVAASTRSAGEILAHMGDLLDWASGLTEGRYEWHDSPPPVWDRGVARFFAAGASRGRSPTLTHVGQIATLRRQAGAGVKGESYYKANITVGRVGLDQAAPNLEFE